MVSAVSSQNVSSKNDTSLSSYQKEFIATLLENYDSSSLSSEDAVAIVSALKDEGIAPSEELASVMDESGFDAREIGDLAGLGGADMPPPPPPQSGNQYSEEEESYVTELLDSLLGTDEDDESVTTSSVANGVSFESVMDYTSRIVNLNEESQEQVMTLLSDLSSEDNELTTDQKATILKHELGAILSNEDNYNRVSYYA
jgi:hypothetical protein